MTFFGFPAFLVVTMENVVKPPTNTLFLCLSDEKLPIWDTARCKHITNLYEDLYLYSLMCRRLPDRFFFHLHHRDLRQRNTSGHEFCSQEPHPREEAEVRPGPRSPTLKTCTRWRSKR